MGNMEKELKRKIRIGKIQKIILNGLKAVGLLGLVIIAPNMIRALSKLGMLPKNGKMAYKSLNRLCSCGLVKFVEENGKKYLRLTEKGKLELVLIEAKNFKLIKPKKWDGKWRIIIFDIPEGRKWLREKIRRTLNAIGFVKLQKSVWVYPYDCEDLITLLKLDFKVGKDILYIIADTVENDKNLKKSFGLQL
ncbi:MAG: hypothetical protein WCT19_01430 [Candidatus Paceibacterota bacterium]|jgi:DNA-binding transcriptional regulator PaaX